jgi:hypothetical protein
MATDTDFQVVPVDAATAEQIQKDNTPQSTNEESSTDSNSNPIGDDQPLSRALEAFEQMKSSGQSHSHGALAAQVTRGVANSRKFDGLEEHEVKWFKAMDNDGYNNLYPKYLAQKTREKEFTDLQAENEKMKGASFFENDEAWTITPEYKQIASDSNRLQAEASHWEEQLALAQQGQPWSAIIKGPDGLPVIEDSTRIGDGAAVAQITAALTRAYTLQTNISNKMQAFNTEFKGKHQSFVSTLADIEKKIFAGADMTKLSKAAESKLSMFPSHIQKQPVTQSLAKALVVIDGLLAMFKNSRNSATSNNMRSSISRAAGPTDGEFQQSNMNGDRKVGDVIADFKKARAAGSA